MKWKQLLFLPIIFYGFPAWTATLSDLLTQTRVYLRDTASSSNRQTFSDSQLTIFLNNAQKEINSRAWAVVSATRITLSVGTTEYSLPTDFILPIRVTLNNAPLVERSFGFFDDGRVDAWMLDTGPPQEYYVRVDSSVVSNVTRESIGIHPVSTFTAVLFVQYLQQPSDLSAGSDVPFSGNYRYYPYHYGLAYFAAYMGWASLGMREDALLFYQNYSSVLSLMQSNEPTRIFYNPNLRGSMPQQSQKTQ